MFQEFLAREFGPYATLSKDQLDLLEAHYRLLRDWNARLNLTRIDSLEKAVTLHYCESLFVGIKLPAGRHRIVDVGSGAGFPGFPIAVIRPECTVTLVESHRRKAVFLSEAGRNLPNVKVVTDRAENLAAEYDWAVARAVAPRDVLKLKLANNLAILVGNDELPELGQRTQIPWGKGRFLAFHVEQPC